VSDTVHNCWLPPPFAFFPFTSPPVRFHVPSHSVSALPSVCIEMCLTLSADGSEVGNMRAEEVLHMQNEEDHLAVALPAVKSADTVCYVCNIVVLTVVQSCTVASDSGSVLCGV